MLSEFICMESQGGRWYKRRKQAPKAVFKVTGTRITEEPRFRPLSSDFKWELLSSTVWTITYSYWAHTWPKAWNLMDFNMFWKWADFQEKAKCNLCLSFKRGSDSRRGSPTKQIKIFITSSVAIWQILIIKGTQTVMGKKGTPLMETLHSRERTIKLQIQWNTEHVK